MRRTLRFMLSALTPVLAAASPGVGQVQPPELVPFFQRRPDRLPYFKNTLSMDKIESVDFPRLSADGRWMVFSGRALGGEGMNLWVVRTTGGPPVQLTTGVHTDVSPAWFPNGDRIAFVSNRTNDVMTIGVDRATGRPVGSLKRVTVDSATVWLDVAPDGRSIVYSTETSGRARIRVVPSTGGPARELADVPGAARFLRYSADGQFVYFGHFPGGGVRSLSRVAAAGGAVSVLLPMRGTGGIYADPIANRVLVRAGQVGNVLTLTGDTVARIVWARGIGAATMFAFSRDGASMYTATSVTNMELHVIPLDGSPVRVLSRGATYDMPWFWRGNRIFYESHKPKFGTMWVISSDGKQRSVVEIDPGPSNLPTAKSTQSWMDQFSDGRHWVIVVDTGGPTKNHPRYVYDSQTRRIRLITRDTGRVRLTVPGGGDFTTMMGTEWVYGVRTGSTIELRAASVSGESRVLRTVPNVDATQSQIAVGPDRVAHYLRSGDTATVLLMAGMNAPKPVLSQPGGRITGMEFSPDGTRLFVLLTLGTGTASKQRAGMLTVMADGSIAQPERWMDLAREHADPRWALNGQSVTTMGQNEDGVKYSAWSFPVRADEQPRIVSQRESVTEWIVPSPDGRELAVGVEKNGGVTLWRIDLKEAATAKGRPPAAHR